MIVTAARRYSGNEFRPNPATGGVGLCSVASSPICNRQSEICNQDEGENVFVIAESEARRLVTAVENCRPSDVIAVIKRQPWFEEIRRGVRKTRHLAPDTYLHLSGHVRASDRAAQLAVS